MTSSLQIAALAIWLHSIDALLLAAGWLKVFVVKKVKKKQKHRRVLHDLQVSAKVYAMTKQLPCCESCLCELAIVLHL